VATPPLEEVFGMLARELPDSARFRTCEAPSIDQLHRREPEFRAAIAFFHMHMRRFGAFAAEEEESEAFDV
jgi:hypothetical protein